MQISVHVEEWALKVPFRIAGAEWRTMPGIVVQLTEGDHVGRGEAQGVDYLGETTDTMIEQLAAIRSQVEAGIDREQLQQLLPAGGARNALDCALWDLECKRSGKSIWQLTGIDPKPVTTVFTIGIESTPEAMAAKAAAAVNSPILKIKLDDHQPYEKLKAIRAARPDAKLVVDANQGWSFPLTQQLLEQCTGLNIDMIEQPLARGADEVLEQLQSPIVLAADESCQDTSELEEVARRYQMVNIKLDKTGGLTEALKLAHEARAAGCQLMVGNMCGTSLSMAPSFVVAQLCDFVDIDGPKLLTYDRPFGFEYQHGVVQGFDSRLWG